MQILNKIKTLVQQATCKLQKIELLEHTYKYNSENDDDIKQVERE